MYVCGQHSSSEACVQYSTVTVQNARLYKRSRDVVPMRETSGLVSYKKHQSSGRDVPGKLALVKHVRPKLSICALHRCTLTENVQ